MEQSPSPSAASSHRNPARQNLEADLKTRFNDSTSIELNAFSIPEIDISTQGQLFLRHFEERELPSNK